MLFDQVKNILKPNHIIRFSSLVKKNQCIKHFRRFLHNEEESSKAKFLCPLKSRSLLKITGCDASSFLQGLITNDMLHFQHGTKTMYALFLNNKGRILYDTLVHKWDSEDHNFLIECDKKVLSSLEKHLRMYKLKRNVEITDMTDALKVWVIVAPQESVPDLTINPDVGVNVFKDPRVANLGTRVITASNVSHNMINESLGSDTKISENEDDYKSIRYRLGVGEGIQDLFPGTIFPLEANCDYLHGVSFHKGCYIGQELLARVHYRGVVRKRIMPIKLLHENPVNISQNSPLVDCDTNKEVGKIKGFVDKYAIGMLRIKEALEAKKLRVGIYEAETYRPAWWPKEAPKEVTKTAS